VSVAPPHTTIVFVDVVPAKAAGLVERLKAAGVLCTGLYRLRFVTHLDVGRADIERAVPVIRAALH
jgi:threonine aldolase